MFTLTADQIPALHQYLDEKRFIMASISRLDSRERYILYTLPGTMREVGVSYHLDDREQLMYAEVIPMTHTFTRSIRQDAITRKGIAKILARRLAA